MAQTVLYLCVARIDGSDVTFAWASGGADADRVVLTNSGAILTFESPQAARAALLAERHAVAADEPAFHDFDELLRWCKSSAGISSAGISSCPGLLRLWNLLADLPREGSLFGAAETRARRAYDKLFWGSNHPAITPPGEHFTPTWTALETAKIKRLLLLGVAEFRGRLAWGGSSRAARSGE
jgi:hypothetical protein